MYDVRICCTAVLLCKTAVSLCKINCHRFRHPRGAAARATGCDGLFDRCPCNLKLLAIPNHFLAAVRGCERPFAFVFADVLLTTAQTNCQTSRTLVFLSDNVSQLSSMCSPCTLVVAPFRSRTPVSSLPFPCRCRCRCYWSGLSVVERALRLPQTTPARNL